MFKKVSIFLFFFIFVQLMIFAQYSPTINQRDFGYSLSEWATGGVFTNQIDAAFSVRQTTAGPGFTDLDRPYLFGGVDNPFNLANSASATPFFSGVFIPGSLPFSFFANINHVNPLAGSGQSLTEDIGGGTIRNFDEINYDTINDQFQLLFNLGIISTGLLYVLDLDDNRVSADNYADTGTTPNVFYDKNGSISTHGFYIPAFLMTGNLSHYAELGFIISTTDWSERDDNTGSGIDFTDKLILIRPQLIYELMLPLLANLNARNQLRTRLTANVTNITHDPSGDLNGDGATTDDSYTSVYPLNFAFYLNVEQALYFNALQSVTMGLLPKLNISFVKQSNGPESTTTNGVTTTNGEDHTTTFTITFSLASAVEFRPEDWPFGILLGVIPTFSNSVATVYDENLTAPAVTKSVTKTWTTNVTHSYGLFVPIEGGYRMDITVGAVGLWDFDNLSIQLVVPLQ